MLDSHIFQIFVCRFGFFPFFFISRPVLFARQSRTARIFIIIWFGDKNVGFIFGLFEMDGVWFRELDTGHEPKTESMESMQLDLIR